MNAPLIRRLILKDWYFMKWPIVGYLALGAIALLLVARGNEGAFYAGSVLLFTVLISMGIHVAMETVVQERTQHTLPFVMSLPISAHDYTLAKVVANVTLFAIPWCAIVVGALVVIGVRDGIPDGLLPYATITLGAILVGYCLTLAVAMVSESQGWTIGAIVAANLGFQAILYSASHLPSIAATMQGNLVAWSPAAVGFLLAELAAALLLVACTFYCQHRKTDFL